MKGVNIFIFSGPGGVGKTTLVNRLFRRKFFKENFIRGISYTTRSKRPKEKNGKDYFFISREEFFELKRKRQLLESEKIVSDYYGTAKSFYDLAKAQRKSLILCIDVKGGMYLKKNLKEDTIVTIFISAPARELAVRMKRREEGRDLIDKRMRLSKQERLFCKDYDYVVENKDIAKSVDCLATILLKEGNK